jgi:glucose/arabinose dehydrogenase
MRHPRTFGAALLAALVAAVSLVIVAPGGAAGPPLPKASNGKKVEVVGTGITTPTAFAFTGSTIFAGSGPNEESGGPGGGLFTLAKGKATKVPNTPAVVFGLAWRSNKLYVSTGETIVALEGWNGTRFSAETLIYASEESGFPGFNGIAFGPEGRLYAGLALNEVYDHSADPFKPSQAVVSMTATGQDFKVVAEGLRQPFQLNFPKGSKYPYVTVLGQDKGGKAPNDEIVVAKPGQNYGFPDCTWILPKQQNACKSFEEPAIFLPPHASPMGIGSIGKTLYVSLFGGTGNGPEVVEMSEKGQPRPLLTGFAAPVIALGVNKGSIYVGDLTGTIYKVAAR